MSKPDGVAATTLDVPLVFELQTQASPEHRHPEYTHRCDVTLFGHTMWSVWGKSAEEAEERGRREIGLRVWRPLRGY